MSRYSYRTLIGVSVFFVAILLSACGNVGVEGLPRGTTGEPADQPIWNEETYAWVMSYFGPEQNLSADSLHLAYSVDGLHWSSMARGRPVYQVTGIGTNHIRDPFILRKNDGTFVYLATDWTRNDYSGYWNNPSPYIFVADSVDLITFTNPRRLRVTDLMGSSDKDMHAWAPEAFYDSERGQYAIIWSGNDTSNVNRIYVSYTTDFQTILNPTPDVFFDPGYSSIDATIHPHGNSNYLFYKDETGSGKDIQIARSASLAAGSFSRWDPDYITRGANQDSPRYTEGPFVLQPPGENVWYMFADFYGEGGRFGAWTTTNLDADPSSWTELSQGVFSFPPGVRHASAFRVTKAELDALIDHYGAGRWIRSNYSSNGMYHYVAHSWYHGIITYLSDTSDGQLSNDFLWNLVPGLSNPSDSSLVSLEPSGFSGRYLHVDSANPGRVPSCSEPSNRIEALCGLQESERTYLTWVDPEEDTAAFRQDATFRRVPALNGDPSMVSFQWLGDPNRYLMHYWFNLFVLVPDGSSADNDAASFAIE